MSSDEGIKLISEIMAKFGRADQEGKASQAERISAHIVEVCPVHPALFELLYPLIDRRYRVICVYCELGERCKT